MRVATVRARGWGDKDVCRLVMPSGWAGRLGLEYGDRVPIRFGSAQSVAEIAAGEWRIELPATRRGLIPAGHTFTLSRADQGFSLGPLMGVMTLHSAGRPAETSSLGPQNGSLRGLAMAAAKLGAVVAVFPPGAIRRGREVINAYVLASGAGGQRWRRRSLPFPDIVYNRVMSRSAERQEPMRALYRRLEDRMGPRFFNPFYLDKWNVYRHLSMLPEAVPYLPVTMRFGGGGLVSMLQRFPVLYLKCSGGSLGLGIIRIEQSGPSRFVVKHQRRPGQVRRVRVTGTGRLREFVRRTITTRRYILQQGIDLARFQDKAYDVRVLAQKDGRGLWTVTGMAARVARQGAIATHVPNGGTREPLLRALRGTFGSEERVREITAELERAARILAGGLDAAMGCRFGELSLDMAVDQDGRVWLLEMNAKPFRFDEDAIREVAWSRLVHYSRHLVGFSPLGGHEGSEAGEPG